MGDGTLFWHEEYAKLKAENERLEEENYKLECALSFERSENDFDCGGVRARLRNAIERLNAEECRLNWAIENPGRFTVITNPKVRGDLTERESIDKVMKDEYDHIG